MKKAIYKITNKQNKKCYIGQSSNPHRRWIAHKSHAKTQSYKKNTLLWNDMKDFGIENFELQILGWYENYNEMEKYFIQKYNTLTPNGYNILPGGLKPPYHYGESHPNSIYNQQTIDNIIDDLLSKKYTQKEIENKYHVSQQLVTSINRGTTHRKKGIDYPIIKTSKYHICDEDFDKIVYLLKYSKCTCAEIGKYFGVDTSAIKAINSGRNHFSPQLKYPIRNFRGVANSQSVETILAKRSTSTIDTLMEK